MSSWFCALRCSAFKKQQPLDKQTSNPLLIFSSVCLDAKLITFWEKYSTFFYCKNLKTASSERSRWKQFRPVPWLLLRPSSFYTTKIIKRVCLSLRYCFPRPLQNTVLVEYNHSWCSRSESCLSGFFLLICFLQSRQFLIEVKARILRMEGKIICDFF